MKLLIWISRIVTGFIFFLSGIVKANDPLGFSYKLQEYFEVFSTKMQFRVDTHASFLPDWFLNLCIWFMEIMHSVSLPLAIVLVVFEVALGVCILTGTKMKFVASASLVLILFFTFLTFVSWKFEIVKTCGCFGTVLELTPFESFIKDVFLLIFIVVLFIYRRSINSLFEETGDRITVGVSFLCASLFAVYTYRHLPFDLSKVMWFAEQGPYVPGADLRFNTTRIEGKKKFFYTLKNLKTGEEKEFDNFTDYKNYKFVSMREEIIVPGIEPKIKDLTMTDEDGINIFPLVLLDTGYTFLLVSYDLKHLGEFIMDGNLAIDFDPTESTRSNFEKINEFAKLAEKEEMKFIGMSASGSDFVGSFRHKLQTPFPFVGTDETVLKTMIRSNPGLLLIKDGKVLRQWHINDFPDFEDLMEQLNINYSNEDL
jgi:uncharacterized membrane protein YphA (DoxX/SURF4 family)